MKKNDPKLAQSSPIYISLLAIGGILTMVAILTIFWPVKPQVKLQPSPPVTESEEGAEEESQPPIQQPTERSPSTLTVKKSSTAQVGLGASLASAPLPTPKSRLSISKDLNLGEHLIQLKGGEWRLRIAITMSSENPEFSRYASPLRRRLIQMLFFLVSHRVPEAMRTVSGEERLRQDLVNRYKNVLRDQSFELYFDSFALEEIEIYEE
jgi:flagellar basal body-associated protein FliL